MLWGGAPKGSGDGTCEDQTVDGASEICQGEVPARFPAHGRDGALWAAAENAPGPLARVQVRNEGTVETGQGVPTSRPLRNTYAAPWAFPEARRIS